VSFYRYRSPCCVYLMILGGFARIQPTSNDDSFSCWPVLRSVGPGGIVHECSCCTAAVVCQQFSRIDSVIMPLLCYLCLPELDVDGVLSETSRIIKYYCYIPRK
jgi:hypothetical protein